MGRGSRRDAKGRSPAGPPSPRKLRFWGSRLGRPAPVTWHTEPFGSILRIIGGGEDMFFDWMTPLSHLPELLQGAAVTLGITVATFLAAFLLGILLGVGRMAKGKGVWGRLVYLLATAYVEAIRNTPALVQIYLIYFGLPEFGVMLKPLVAGIVALVINNSAYIAETVRAGLQSISKGQHEAAEAIGLDSWQVFRLVVFPQAIRNIFPALGNQLIMIVFGTSLLSIIDVRELTDVALILNAETFRTIEIFVVITAIYYVMTISLARILAFLDKRLFPAKL